MARKTSTSSARSAPKASSGRAGRYAASLDRLLDAKPCAGVALLEAALSDARLHAVGMAMHGFAKEVYGRDPHFVREREQRVLPPPDFLAPLP